MFESDYRVVFTDLQGNNVASWVQARNDHTAVAMATMFAVSGQWDTERGADIRAMLTSGNLANVYAVLETN